MVPMPEPTSNTRDPMNPRTSPKHGRVATGLLHRLQVVGGVAVLGLTESAIGG